MKYVDASAVLRLLFAEPGSVVPLTGDDRVVSLQLVEVETFRAVDRARLIGNLDDTLTAIKRKELGDLLAMMDLAPVDDLVLAGARSSFAVTVRASTRFMSRPLRFWPRKRRTMHWSSGHTTIARRRLRYRAASPYAGSDQNSTGIAR